MVGFGAIGKGFGTYFKNMSHVGIKSAQKGLDSAQHELTNFKESPFPKFPDGAPPTRANYPVHINQLENNVGQAEKNLHNAKVSHNRTVAGTAIGAVAAGAGLNGYAGYKKNSMNPEVNDLMTQNQVSQQDQLMKSASEELSEIIHDNLIDRLEKSAGIAYIPVQVPDQGDQGDVASAQQAEVAPLPQPNDPTQPDGSGGIDPAQLGITQQDQEQEGPAGDATQVAPATGIAPAGAGDPAFDASGAPVTDGAEPVSPESQELQAILAAQAAERENESTPGTADGGGNPRQGAGSVSNAPAGEDKTASELLARLEKTANEFGGEEDDEDDSKQPGRQPRKKSTETWLGMGPIGHWAKENNKMGVKPEDSHAKANAKVGAIAGGTFGAVGGAASGAVGAGLQHLIKGKLGNVEGVEEFAHEIPDTPIAQAALVGGIIGGAMNAGLGAAGGAINGSMHDAWDKHHPVNPEEEEQTAMEDNLFARLEKTAADAVNMPYEVDNSPAGGEPGDKAKQDGNFWHKLSPSEVQEEDQTEPNDKQKALYERLTQSAGGYDAASQAANLSKKAADDNAPIDPDHDGDDDRPGSKNNPDKAEDDKSGVTAKAAKEEAAKKAKDGDKKPNPFFANQGKKDDKEDEEGQDKKAFAIPGLGGLVGRAGGLAGHAGGVLKEFGGHLSGSNYRNALGHEGNVQNAFNHNQALLDKYNTPEALMEHAHPETGVGVAAYRNNLEYLDANRNALSGLHESAINDTNAAKSSMNKTRGAVGVAGGLAGLGFAGHAAIQHHNNEAHADQPMEQNASEDDLMNGLFKEAAAMIINEEIPEVKQHVDIMNRIKF